MRILHTSDWHLGAEMEGRKRIDETHALLGFIADTINRESIDTLLVTGDVFDTHAPSNFATKLYYDFLKKLRQETQVRNVVIIAGNHDSPSYLEAPAGLLELLQIHIIGSIDPLHPEREVIPLMEGDEVAAVACAVPYLIAPGLPGRTQAEQDAAYEAYVVEHYQRIIDLAKTRYPDVPLIAMGHFFAVGGKVSDQGVVRGNIHSVNIQALPLDKIDYLALGHLHRPQCVHGLEKVHYAGSLLKMSFLECGCDKELLVWDTASPQEFKSIPITREQVPQICRMAICQGDVDELKTQLRTLQEQETLSGGTSPLWVAVLNTGVFHHELKNTLDNFLGENSGLDLVFCRNQNHNPVLKERGHQTLKQLTPEILFNMFLEQNGLDGGEQALASDELEWYRLKLREAIAACENEDKL